MNTPLVSICIPAYNAALTIKQTLDSVLKQTYSNIEVLVVDNCSTDNTKEIVRSFADVRLKLIENEVNIGAWPNCDRCIELATGEYIAIYHADDVYESEMVQKQVEFLQTNAQAGVVLTAARLIDEQSKPIKLCSVPAKVLNANNTYTFSQLIKGILHHSNFLFCPSAMVRSSIYKNEIVSWRGDLFASSADLDVWLRIASHHLVGILPIPLLNYRISSHQWSAQVRRTTERADFFKVMDFYLQQAQVQEVVNKEDLRHYQDLERRDKVMRAVNCFLQGRKLEAKNLSSEVFSLAAITSAFKSKRAALTLALTALLRLLLIVRAENSGKQIVQGLMVKFKK